MTTSWSIEVDWDRKGNFDGQYDDVTNRTVMAQWFLGERKPYQEAADEVKLSLILDNSDKRFSPEYQGGPLHNKLHPFKPVRIQSNDGSTIRTHWVGWIESIQPKVNSFGELSAEITAAGPMQFFKSAETGLELQENLRTDEIIAALLQEVVIPPALVGAWILGRVGNSEVGQTTRTVKTAGYSTLDEGVTTLAIAGDNWVTRGGRTDEQKNTFDVYRAIKDVAAAERGRFLFSRDGKALFWNRHHLLQGEAPVAPFDNTMKDLVYQYAGLDDFKNEIVVTCHPRTITESADVILWELAEAVKIPGGETRTINAKYQDESGNRIGGKNISLTNVKFKQGTATIKLEEKANSASLEITNTRKGEAVLTSCVLRGQKITDFGQMEATAIDAASMVDYGRRTMKMNLPSVDNFDNAQQIAYFELHRRSQPRGAVSSLSLSSHGLEGGGEHTHQLARTLGDKITLKEAQTAHKADYYIIGEQHKLSAGATLLETTWYLEPASTHYPWKLGVERRSELGRVTSVTY